MKPSSAQANPSCPDSGLRPVVGSRLDEEKRRALQASRHQEDLVLDVRESFGFMPMQLQGKAVIRWRNL